MIRSQWRIQDFPEVGAPTLQEFCPNFPKTAWNWNNLGLQKFHYVDPPLEACENVAIVHVLLTLLWQMEP